MIAKNKGLVSKTFNSNPDETPMINGYKMLKETPQRDSNEESAVPMRNKWLTKSDDTRGKFVVPNTPMREEVGLMIANRT